MKKIFVKICALVAASVVMLSLTACGNSDKTKRIGYGYGLVYNATSLCRVRIEMTGDQFDNVEIDEVGLISDWSRKSEIASGDIADEDWKTIAVGESEMNYAKKVQFGDKVFAIGDNGKYALADGTQFEKWIAEEENAEFYWERMKAGDYHILKADGDKYNVTYLPRAEGQTTEKSKRFFKSENGYWPAGGHGKGYSANMKAISEFIKAKGTGLSADSAEKNDKGNYVLGGVDTGASVTSFKEYYAVAQKAYDNRKDMSV